MSGEELYLAKLPCFKSPFWLLKKGDINNLLKISQIIYYTGENWEGETYGEQALDR